MKVMISQPMANRKEEDIKKERQSITEILEKQGYEVIDTLFTEEPPKDSDKAIWYLAKSIEAMGKVDGVVFLPGWTSARGCVVENQVATTYQKFILYI